MNMLAAASNTRSPTFSAIQRLSRIQLVCSDVDRIAHFYESVFGFVRTREDARVLSARSIDLKLGEQSIELLDFHPSGRAYPPNVTGANLLFQHFAIVVRDMTSAYARLATHGGWTPISIEGPQQLPLSSGGVTAFKFRDPDGHPLELLAFRPSAVPRPWQAHPTDKFLGIDHSALSIADTKRSVFFYEQLGLAVAGSSTNLGPEQERLDGMSQVQVEVTSLLPALPPTPHVELLAYRNICHAGMVAALDDIAATRLVLAVTNPADLAVLCRINPASTVAWPANMDGGVNRAMLRDPDGHLVLLENHPE